MHKPNKAEPCLRLAGFFYKIYLPRFPAGFREGALGAGLPLGLGEDFPAAFAVGFAAGLEAGFPAGFLVPGLGGGAP